MLYQPFTLFLLFISNKINKRIMDIPLKSVINLCKSEDFNEEFNNNDDDGDDEDDFNENFELEFERINLKTITEEEFFRHRGYFSGNDERFFKNNEKDKNLISILHSIKIKRENEFNYLENKHKLELLKKLQSSDLSIDTKIKLIPIEKLFVSDIFNAGLINDWKMDI